MIVLVVCISEKRFKDACSRLLPNRVSMQMKTPKFKFVAQTMDMAPTAVTRFDCILVYYQTHSDLKIMRDYIRYFNLAPIKVFYGESVVSGASKFNALSFGFSEHEQCREHIETQFK